MIKDITQDLVTRHKIQDHVTRHKTQDLTQDLITRHKIQDLTQDLVTRHTIKDLTQDLFTRNKIQDLEAPSCLNIQTVFPKMQPLHKTKQIPLGFSTFLKVQRWH